MPSKYKYKKPRMSTVSSVPAIYFDRNSIRNMNELKFQMPKRLPRGRELFLLEIASILREEVKNKAPEVIIGGEEVDYAKDLRITILNGVDDMEAVAIYFDTVFVKLNNRNVDSTVLFISSIGGSPKWVSVLAKYGPWPANILPISVGKRDGRVVSRRARPDEMKALSERILGSRGEIENELRGAGAPQYVIGNPGHGVGMAVNEDIGFNVLRVEFGYNGEAQRSHWRPALKAVKDRIPKVGDKFIKYIMTGKESIFDLPKDIEDVNKAKIMEGAKFTKTIAPFAPKG